MSMSDTSANTQRLFFIPEQFNYANLTNFNATNVCNLKRKQTKKRNIYFLYNEKWINTLWQLFSSNSKLHRSWIYLYHASTWVSHWRWKNILQLNTTNKRRKNGRNYTPLFPQVSEVHCSITVTNSHAITFLKNLCYKDKLLDFFLQCFSYMPMTLCGEILNCI